MSNKRIVVTGMGVVSCLGHDVNLFYDQLVKGVSGISMITGFPCEDFSTRFAGEIKDFNVGDYLDPKRARRVDKAISYAIFSGKKALEMANIPLDSLDRLKLDRCGVVIGSGMGGMQTYADNVVALHEKGVRRISPFFIPYILTNMPGAMLAMECGFKGPNYSISTACATGNNSIIAAAQHIRNGEADLMVTGGVEAAIGSLGLGGFVACKALSQRNDAPERASRPWDRDRDGFVMGEGAGVLVLESLEHALARGAPIIAEYLGGGLSCDAYHITDPHPEGKGVELCLRNALKDAGISAEEIEYINAHATSTPVGDMAEVEAVKKVIPRPEKVVINATKSMIGHALGAAGGLEAIATIKAITDGVIHPTLNLENPEPGLTFIAPKEALKKSVSKAISNSFGFGGHNASVIFGAYNG